MFQCYIEQTLQRAYTYMYLLNAIFTHEQQVGRVVTAHKKTSPTPGKKN